MRPICDPLTWTTGGVAIASFAEGKATKLSRSEYEAFAGSFSYCLDAPEFMPAGSALAGFRPGEVIQNLCHRPIESAPTTGRPL